MSQYEFTFIVDDAQACKKLEEVLKSFAGKKIDDVPWGTLDYAYPINKKTSGDYYTWIIEIAPEQIIPFKQKLNYDNILVRYLMLKDNGSVALLKKKNAEVKEE